MKKLLLTLLVVLASCGKEEVAKPKSAAEQSRPIVNRDSENVLDAIADPHFLSWAEAQMDIWDKDGDGVLSQAEAAGVKKISLPVGGEIASLAGIEHFTGLTYLTCTENRLSSLDLSHNTSLETLGVDFNDLVSLTLPRGERLSFVTCEVNELTALDVSGCAGLAELHCGANLLTRLDVSTCPKLKNLQCWNNSLTSLDLSGNRALTKLNCQVNAIASLNLKGCKELKELQAICCQLKEVDISHCPELWLCSVEENPGTNGIFTIHSIYNDHTRPHGKIPGRDYNFWFPTEWILYTAIGQGTTIKARYVVTSPA